MISTTSKSSPTFLFVNTNNRSYATLFTIGLALTVLCLILFSGWQMSSLTDGSSSADVFDLDTCHARDIDGSKLQIPDVSPVDLWKHNRKLICEHITNYTDNEMPVVMISGRSLSVGNEGLDFVQDSNFMYLSGFSYPDAQLFIRTLDGFSVLVLKRQSMREIAFDGKHPDAEAIEREFAIDIVCFDDEIVEILKTWFMGLGVLFGVDEDVRKLATQLNVHYDLTALPSALKIQRRVKSSAEISMIRYATQVAATAHLEMMQRVTSQSSETSLLALFRHLTSLCGCRVQAYSPIVGASNHAAVLHYQAMNDTASSIHVLPNDVILADASGAYNGYASDITRTFPLHKFTPEMELVYKIVLEANMLGISLVHAGVKYSSIANQVKALMVFLLKRHNFLIGEMDVLLQSGVDSVFMPHGLGHSIGLDVHDVQPASMILQVHDVVTVEPGIYFNRPLFDDARNSYKFSSLINWELVDKYLDANAGGVRIEDVVLVTEQGYENLSSQAPKILSEIYAVMHPMPRRLHW